MRTARLADCQTHEEFTAATAFVIATRLASALLKKKSYFDTGIG